MAHRYLCGHKTSYVPLSICSMRYVSAYLLAVLGGNESPSAADLKNILDSVGIEVDNDLAGKVVNNLKGKSLDELMAEGEYW